MVATGGNKVRKLEWLIGEARAQGATHIVTQGAVQSNHVRQTAAVARKFGMKCTALLEHRIDTNDRDYLGSGNVLLDKLFGCAIEYRPGRAGHERRGREEGQRTARRRREAVYVIPGGGSNKVGALGYVSCAQELMQQADEMGLRIDRIVTATGSAGTHAGLVVGLEGMNAGVPVLGIGVRLPRDRQEENVYRLAEATAEYVGYERRRLPARPWSPIATTSAPATAFRPRAWARRCACWRRRRGSCWTRSIPARRWPG